MPYSGGLKRNIVQCLNDFDIPLKLSHTVVDIQGKERVTGVTIAQVDEKSRPIPGTEEHYDCDTLLLSVGLIPENELSRQVGVEMAPATNGPKVNESLETSIPGVFACGNVLHVHDLVDYVSEEAVQAGRHAARYILEGREESGREIPPGASGSGALHRALHPLPPAHGGGDRGALPGGAEHPQRPGAGAGGRPGAAHPQAPGDGPRRDGTSGAQAGVVLRERGGDHRGSCGRKGGNLTWLSSSSPVSAAPWAAP